MALQQALDPLAQLRKAQPGTGAPVQNMGGGQPNTAPLALRPVAQPAVNTASPGRVSSTAMANPTVGNLNLDQMKAAAPALTGIANPNPAGVAPGGVGFSNPNPAPAAQPAPNQYAPVMLGTGTGAMVYGPSGGTSAVPGSIEDQLRQYMTQSFGGVTSKAFVDRAKNQLGAATEGQRNVAVNRINNDAIKRGLFKSGIPSEQAAAADTQAQGSFAQGLANILSNAEQQDIQGKQAAAGVGTNLLGMNRSLDQFYQTRADEINARNASAAQANAAHQFQFVDPDTGASYTIDDRWLQG